MSEKGCICSDPTVRENIPCPVHPPERGETERARPQSELDALEQEMYDLYTTTSYDKRVVLQVNHQSFDVGYVHDDPEEGVFTMEWSRRMLAKALANLVREQRGEEP